MCLQLPGTQRVQEFLLTQGDLGIRQVKLSENLIIKFNVFVSEKDYFECDKCDKTFKWKEGLKAHREKHEQDKEAT